MVGNPNLKDQPYLDTFPGQAHFADPKSIHTCRECEHWASQGKSEKGLLKDSPCLKAFKSTWKVPHYAKACRHFEDNPLAPQA